jgi:Uma2 family endonuclease
MVSPTSFEEFEHLPDDPGKRELIDGQVIELPPPKLQDSKVARELFASLSSPALEEFVWAEAGYRVAGGWIQPDVSVQWPDQAVENGYLIGSPRIAVEVLSPAETASHIERKLTLLFSEKCAEVWVADPRSKTLVVYQRTDNLVTRIPVEDEFYSPASGITLKLSAIFEPSEHA